MGCSDQSLLERLSSVDCWTFFGWWNFHPLHFHFERAKGTVEYILCCICSRYDVVVLHLLQVHPESISCFGVLRFPMLCWLHLCFSEINDRLRKICVFRDKLCFICVFGDQYSVTTNTVDTYMAVKCLSLQIQSILKNTLI
ncbi:hypothetical protein Droror1_Dr00020094 [Drosera rotundifolia]